MKRRINPTAALLALGMARRLSKGEQAALSVVYWAALDEMTAGRGNESHFDSLAGAVNLALVLAERAKNNAEAIALIQSAQDALMRAQTRKARHGHYGFDGIGLQHIRDVLSLHDEQLALCTGRQMVDAMNAAIRRMKAGQVLEVA